MRSRLERRLSKAKSETGHAKIEKEHVHNGNRQYKARRRREIKISRSYKKNICRLALLGELDFA